MLATDDEAVIEAYRAFGWALGIAFQLNDDLLGIWGEETATGKAPSDLAAHKRTLPMLYALEHGGPEDRERLAELLGLGSPTPVQVDEARRILERSGARDYTRGQARRYRDEALRQLALTGAVDDVARERLEQIIVTAIDA
jgi:geranylgeranyl diphosphate synthase type I